MLPDGTVLLADKQALRAWRPDAGDLETHAELSRPIHSFGIAGPHHVLAVLENDTAWLVDLAPPGRVELTEPVGTSSKADPARTARDPDPADRADPDRAGPGPGRPRAGARAGAARAVAISLAADTGTLVVPSNGGVNVVDAVGHFTWALAVQPPAQPLRHLQDRLPRSADLRRRDARHRAAARQARRPRDVVDRRAPGRHSRPRGGSSR